MDTSNHKAKDFLKLLEQHKRLIIKIAGTYFADPSQRNDVMQEIALQLWKGLSKLKQSPESSTWVYRIALNVTISYFRKESNRKKTLSNYQKQLPVFEIREEKFEEKLQILYQLISHLNPIEKAIIILHLDGCKNGEIADIVGLSLSNISTKINRIKTKLIHHYKTNNSRI